MNIRKRKIMFYTFIVAFFAISFFTVIYAQGYRFNWVWPPTPDRLFQKTGMLLVKTQPEGARILVNGQNPRSFWRKVLSEKTKPIKTPAKIQRLNPDTYNLTLSRQGYHDWKREITVHPGKITSLTDIHLVKDNLPSRVTEKKVDPNTLSPSARHVLTRDRGHVLDLTSEKTTVLTTTTATSAVKWSPDEEKILIGDHIFNREKGEKVLQWEPMSSSTTTPEWGENSETIYYWDEKTLTELSLDSQDIRPITTIKGRIIDYKITDNYIYTMSASGNSCHLNVYSRIKKKKTKMIDFPLSDGYRIASTPNSNDLTIHDTDFNTLYIISPLALVSPLQETVTNVKYFDWLNPNQMIYGNDFEIWSLDLARHNKDLITRRSKRIQGINTHPDTSKTIYYTSRHINIIEKVNPRLIKTTELIELPAPITKIFLGPEKKNLYFNAEIGHHQGLYKLTIY